MARIIRLGVVGAGAISIRGIFPHLSQPDVQDRVRMVAVCDPVPGRAATAAAQYGIGRAFTSYADLLASGEVDAVTIATPIGLHYEQGRQALEAGLHVHFNKTMTTTVAEATDLIHLARAKGRKIVASPGEVLRPRVQQIKKLIAEGAIGVLSWAVVGRGGGGTWHLREEMRQGDGVLANVDPSWYYRKPGGGPMYDGTVYGLHNLTTVLGPAKAVTAMSGLRLPQREFRGRIVPCDMDDNTFMILDYGNGLYAFSYGAVAGSVVSEDSGSYFGTEGAIIGRNLKGEPYDYPGKDPLDTTEQGYGRGLPHVKGAHANMSEAHVFEDIMQLVDWVLEGRPTPVTAEHARHVIDIIESAYRAAQTGQTQCLTTTF